jgi:energy-coupling factor transporter ATP-binding protein EcfA2
MELQSIIYSENPDYEKTGIMPWETELIEFGKINLIVGKNAVGKSRLINVINALAQVITGDLKVKQGDRRLTEGSWMTVFKNNKKEYRYELKIHNAKVEKEELRIDDKILLSRNSSGKGELFYEEQNQNIPFQMSSHEVAVTNIRDSLQHNFLNPLVSWAEDILKIEFGTTMGRERVPVFLPKPESIDIPQKSPDYSNIVRLFLEGVNKYGDIFKTQIIDDVSSLGYNIKDIGVSFLPNFSVTLNNSIPLDSKPQAFFVDETDLDNHTFHHHMSQGMYRAIDLIVCINYNIMKKDPICVLLDDVGEGLDYDRSTLLINLIIKKVLTSSIQLIMTTNDRFVMNKVPLEYWMILKRNGGKISHYSYRNSRDTFDEYELLGLNNFDIFTTDFFNK